MLKRLLSPRAIVSHLLVLTVAVGCVSLGLWQLDRLSQVRENNALLAERMQRPPLEVADLAGGPVDADELEFRRVSVTGTFRPAEEVLQRGRQHNQQQGFHVLTPLELDSGEVVLVRRGWVPARYDEPPVADAAPPEGRVSVTGLLEKPVGQPAFGPRDPDEGALARVFHADTERLDAQISGELFPMVFRLDGDENAPFDALPVGLVAPVLDEANHLSYALQWFSFAALALVTYVVWLVTRGRRLGARGRAGDERHGADNEGVTDGLDADDGAPADTRRADDGRVGTSS